MEDKEILSLLKNIETKLAVIEEKLDNKPTKLECQVKHSKQNIFNVVISIIIAIFLFNIKLSSLLKLLGL